MLFNLHQVWFCYFYSLEVLKCPCCWRWESGREQHPGTNMGSLGCHANCRGSSLATVLKAEIRGRPVSQQVWFSARHLIRSKGPQGHFLDLCIQEGFFHFLWQQNSLATIGGDFYTDSLCTQYCK